MTRYKRNLVFDSVLGVLLNGLYLLLSFTTIAIAAAVAARPHHLSVLLTKRSLGGAMLL